MGTIKDAKELIETLSNMGNRKVAILVSAIFLLGVLTGMAFPKWPIIPSGVKKGIGEWFGYENMASIYGPPSQPKTISIPGAEGSSDKVCITYTQFDKNKQEWPFRSYKGPDEDGFYCAKESSVFLTPPIWYSDLIPADFEVIEISARIINQDNDATSSPSFVVFFGDDPPIWVLHMFEDSPQMVGFEKLVFATTSEETNKLQRESPGRVLVVPLQYGTQIDIAIKPLIKLGNEATFSFDFSYISSRDGKATTGTLDYEVLLPFPNPSIAEARFGFGTSITACIKPIRFMVCYVEQ